MIEVRSAPAHDAPICCATVVGPGRPSASARSAGPDICWIRGELHSRRSVADETSRLRQNKRDGGATCRAIAEARAVGAICNSQFTIRNLQFAICNSQFQPRIVRKSHASAFI